MAKLFEKTCIDIKNWFITITMVKHQRIYFEYKHNLLIYSFFFQSLPVVRVAIQLKHCKDFKILKKWLKLLNKLDTATDISSYRGEDFMAGFSGHAAAKVGQPNLTFKGKKELLIKLPKSLTKKEETNILSINDDYTKLSSFVNYPFHNLVSHLMHATFREVAQSADHPFSLSQIGLRLSLSHIYGETISCKRPQFGQ